MCFKSTNTSILSSSVLVVDEKVLSSGKVLELKDIIKLLERVR